MLTHPHASKHTPPHTHTQAMWRALHINMHSCGLNLWFKELRQSRVLARVASRRGVPGTDQTSLACCLITKTLGLHCEFLKDLHTHTQWLARRAQKQIFKKLLRCKDQKHMLLRGDAWGRSGRVYLFVALWPSSMKLLRTLRSAL